MKKTLLASAVALTLGVTGHALAQTATDDAVAVNVNVTDNDTTTTTKTNSENRGRAWDEGLGTTAANNGSTSTANFSNAFNTSRAVAMTRLNPSRSLLAVDLRMESSGRY